MSNPFYKQEFLEYYKSIVNFIDKSIPMTYYLKNPRKYTYQEKIVKIKILFLGMLEYCKRVGR